MKERMVTYMGQNSTFDATRAGKTPDDTLLPYVISTQEMGLFIQKKLDAVIAEVNRTLPPDVPKIPIVRIQAYTAKMGEYCYPLVLILPNEAFQKKQPRQRRDQSNNQRNGNSMSIGGYISDSEQEDRSYERVYNPIYSVLEKYFYVKPRKTFSTPDVRRFNQMTTSEANQVIRYASRINVMRNGKRGPKSGIVMLDPFAVMHDMLTRPNDPRAFEIIINSVKSKKNGKYDFRVTRKILMKKDQNGSNDFNSLMRKLRQDTRGSIE